MCFIHSRINFNQNQFNPIAMSKLTCPNCNEAFEVDEQGYSKLVSQVRDQQFEKELKRQEQAMESEKATAVERAVNKVKENLSQEIQSKQLELAKMESGQQNKILEVSNGFEKKIQELESKLKAAETQKELDLAKALKVVEDEKNRLRAELEKAELAKELEKQSIEDSYKTKLIAKDDLLRMKDEEVQRYKDFKQSQSTKMIGESLEQHCENEFNKLRATAFPTAYFEKDNDASSGSKGDFIFREFDQNEIEIVSIMFEMKNEADTTATKKKNEDFFKELDKDRNQKGCEYAVLVSMLESDNDYYNQGIVDVSHRYPKMYVIRPQFFIALISLLRNSALNALKYKQELEKERSQNIDITNFESEMEAFKQAFGKNYELANRKFNDAISQIDKTINSLQKVKENLMSSDRQLRLANDKADGLTIKKLTKNSPSLRDKFKELGE